LIELKVRKVALRVFVVWARFEQQHVEPAAGKFFGDNGTAAARPYDDDVTHLPSSDS
jgi:hypothetical protein